MSKGQRSRGNSENRSVNKRHQHKFRGYHKQDKIKRNDRQQQLYADDEREAQDQYGEWGC